MEKIIKSFKVRTFIRGAGYVNDIIKVVEFGGAKWDAPDDATPILDYDINYHHDHTVVAIPDDLSETLSEIIKLEYDVQQLNQRLTEIKGDIKLLSYGFTLKSQGINYPIAVNIDDEFYVIGIEDIEDAAPRILFNKATILSKNQP